MPPRAVVVLIGLLLFAVLGFVIPLVVKARLTAHLKQSQFNLARLTFFAAHHARPDPNSPAHLLPHEIPAATVVLSGVRPDDRLSWAVAVLPWLADRRFVAEDLVQAVRTDRPFSDPANQQVARARLAIFLCPENPPAAVEEQPAPTCYVGLAGLGTDAAEQSLPAGLPPPPRAGAFRYDSPTPFDRIADGLSQTLLMGETADGPGPWLRGGPATIRGVDDRSEARPLLGIGGQFGGFFPNGGNFALCDGSVRWLTSQITPRVFHALVTIAGGPDEARTD